MNCRGSIRREIQGLAWSWSSFGVVVLGSFSALERKCYWNYQFNSNNRYFIFYWNMLLVHKWQLLWVMCACVLVWVVGMVVDGYRGKIDTWGNVWLVCYIFCLFLCQGLLIKYPYNLFLKHWASWHLLLSLCIIAIMILNCAGPVC